jgi:IclR family KDG regulon transcriptional repressor
MPLASAKKAKNVRSSVMSSTLRCLQVLELLAEEPFELNVSDIAKTLSIPRASVHRLCTTLVEGGFVEYVRAYKRYRITAKSLWVGSGYLRHSTIYRAAFLPMQTLGKQVPGSVQLGVLFDGEVLFIHSVGYPKSPHAFADVGLRRPLHATASGKIFLAEMPLDEVKRLMLHGVKSYTKYTTVSLAQMKKELAQVAVKGYAVNDEELLSGYLVLAAPVFDSVHSTVGAISITLSIEHADSKEMEISYAALLCEAAHNASLQLGYHPHSHLPRSKR